MRSTSDVRGDDALANIMFPGQSYYHPLRRFHEWLRPKSYIEIGVSTGASIILAKSPTVAVGIDPNPQLLSAARTVCKIFPITSDEYFAVRDACADLEAETVDLAFIDGLHLFEQVLRDFINIERISNYRTVVLIHDTFAIDALTAERERKTDFWTGDYVEDRPVPPRVSARPTALHDRNASFRVEYCEQSPLELDSIERQFQRDRLPVCLAGD